MNSKHEFTPTRIFAASNAIESNFKHRDHDGPVPLSCVSFLYVLESASLFIFVIRWMAVNGVRLSYKLIRHAKLNSHPNNDQIYRRILAISIKLLRHEMQGKVTVKYSCHLPNLIWTVCIRIMKIYPKMFKILWNISEYRDQQKLWCHLSFLISHENTGENRSKSVQDSVHNHWTMNYRSQWPISEMNSPSNQKWKSNKYEVFGKQKSLDQEM